ncbi:MAG: DUF368 domain-containing protein [Verrucomicrobiales bacterium]|nr:DUF368 domain-containing protein [Verrucomicrobiales bacterium]
MPKLIDDLFLLLKGSAMGAANVIPGVSGGTVAFLTGIYERLIDAIKAFDLNAIKLLFKLRFKEFSTKIELRFLFAIGLGAFLSVLSLARVLEFLFESYQTQTWAFFFGLILASVIGVSRFIEEWNFSAWVSLIVGVMGASTLLFIPQTEGGDSFVYLLLCGVAAISSMIIPGISGSFVLLVMGNYQMILGAIVDLDFGILVPFAIGCLLGIICLSHLISWIFKKYRNVAVGLITGFVIGSLLLIWPWKEQKYETNHNGEYAVKIEHGDIEYRSNKIEEVITSIKGDEELVVIGYKNWSFPNLKAISSWYAIMFAFFGFFVVIFIDRTSKTKTNQHEKSK